MLLKHQSSERIKLIFKSSNWKFFLNYLKKWRRINLIERFNWKLIIDNLINGSKNQN